MEEPALSVRPLDMLRQTTVLLHCKKLETACSGINVLMPCMRACFTNAPFLCVTWCLACSRLCKALLPCVCYLLMCIRDCPSPSRGLGGVAWNLLTRTLLSCCVWRDRTCKEVWKYDGFEDCIVLQTAGLGFTWELLMKYSAQYVSNNRVTFYGFWCGEPLLCLPPFHCSSNT